MALNKKALTGAALAIAAAGLVFSAHTMAEGSEAKVQCSGINSCKGQTACKSASNDCKGQNSCKGKGWTPTASAEECEKKGGKSV